MRTSHLRSLSWVLLLAAVLSLPALSFLETARAQGKPEKAPEKSFLSLRDERDAVEKDIRLAEKDAEDLGLQQYWLKAEANLKWQLAGLQKDKNTSSEELTRVQNQINVKRESAATSLSLEEVNGAIEKKQGELKDKKRQKEIIETEINRKIDLEKPKQEFKTNISFYFTILIGLVITGFFAVAFKDPTVRREIFSGQAGIQFITLFSLVIAIILFGITGVLEGKELAALLGGLSGYILGRSTGSRSTSAQPNVSSPRITDVSPKTVTLGAVPITLPVQVVGTDLQLANSVKIVQGTKDIPVSNIASNDLAVNRALTLDPSLPKGIYDVIVANSDGGVGKLTQAFTVQ